MDAGRRTITEIFNRMRSLAVPFFQRAYVWDEENWERFLEDMLTITRDDRDYFLGSVILKQLPIPSGAKLGDFRVVVDGQQRLTTIVLFFKVLTKARGEEGEFRDLFFNMLKEVGLKHNHNDVEIFEAIVHDRLNDELTVTYQTNQVWKAFQYFTTRADELKEIAPIDLLKHIYFVGIDLGEKEDEQQIFDTINSLGVALSTAELLKNELFRREDLELYNITWKATFEEDEDTRNYWSREITAGRSRRQAIDLMLQSFLAIESGAANEFSRVDSLFDNYRRFLSQHGKEQAKKTAFIERLQNAARVFRENVRPDDLDGDIDAADRVSRLNVLMLGMNITTVVPYFHYLLLHVKEKNEREGMFALLETFLVRRLVCRETSKNYNNFFGSLLRNRVSTSAMLEERLLKGDDGTIPSDDDFSKGWQRTNLTNQQARIVLYLLEKSIRAGDKYGTSPLGVSRYSLEHIMPKKWRNHWGVLGDAEQERLRDQLLLKLGNLTLLTSSLNSAIRDADWSTKKKGKGNNDGLEKYGRGLEIFDEELALSDWDEAAIEKRSARLLEQALVVWPHPSNSR